MNRKTIWKEVGVLSAAVWLVAVAALLPAQPVQDWDPATSESAAATEPADETTELRFNFKGVPLDTVLDYMSRAAGFVIVKTVDVDGRVNVVSEQPLSPDEAVSLLDTVLGEQGYAAVRSGRILKIVKKDDARTHDLPVRTGNDPDAIQRSDQIITQIIPVRHASAKELVENLKDLLPSSAVITYNEKSNSVILTDTQTNVRRMVEIIQALDKSISEITTIRVFRLQYSDAKEIADMIKELFKPPQESASGRDRTSRRFFPFGPRDDNNQQDSNGSSPALQAASTVNAVPDEQTNSVVVSGPEEVMPAIEQLITQVDRSADVLTEVRVFHLQYADAEQMADVISGVFGEDSGTSSRTSSANQSRSGRRGSFFARMMQRAASRNNEANNGDQSVRQQAADTVLAVADTRTNSVVISAIHDTMEQIAQVVVELDKNPAKTKRVYVYTVQNADPEEVAATLQDMFGGSNSSGSSNRRTTTNNRNTNTTRNTNSTRGSNSGSGSRTSR